MSTKFEGAAAMDEIKGIARVKFLPGKVEEPAAT